MKFYRVHKRIDAGTSAGHEYFTSKREAERAVREWDKDAEEGDTAELDVIEIEPTKNGILRALNLHANYPDNG